jgi:hypothetical protein
METIKRIAEKVAGWRRPDKPRGFVRERKPQTFRMTGSFPTIPDGH